MKNFLGINNVADSTRLAENEFSAATNVDIGSQGNLLSRRGRSLLSAGLAHSVYEASFGVLAVVAGDLVLMTTAGVPVRTVYATLGYTRVWYDTLPDGRVAFSNGHINGLVSASSETAWGVPIPVDPGVGLAGDTPYQICYARISSGLEGAPVYGTMNIDTTADIIGLPVLAGHRINVYFAPYGGTMFLAGSTLTDTFTASGNPLGAQYLGSGLGRMPVGILVHAWNSRVLMADGNVLWASRPFQPELCDLTTDFVQMPDTITLLYGTNDGLFVGTTKGMYFLAGLVFADMKAQNIASGAVSLGSGVEIPLNYLNEKARPQNILQGTLCLVGGAVHLIYGGGSIMGLTSNRYIKTAAEVRATARLRDGVLQYIAAPA